MRCVLSLLGVLMVSPLARAGAPGEVPLFAMDFAAPYQTDGQGVATDDSNLPRLGPSALSGAAPTIDVIEAPDPDQQMTIRPGVGSATIVNMGLTGLNPIDPNALVFNRYSTVLTFTADGLAGTGNEIEIQFFGADASETTGLEIRSDGSVFAVAGGNEGFADTGATFEENEEHWLEIIIDLDLGLWTVFLDQDEILRDDETPLTMLSGLNIVSVRTAQPSLVVDMRGIHITGIEDGFEQPDLSPADSFCDGDPGIAPDPREPLYDVAFDEPDNEVGEPPASSFGGDFREGVSSFMGDAIIAHEQGSNSDHALLLLGRGDSITTSHSRVRFYTGLNEEDPFPDCYERYTVQFEITVLDIKDGTDSFTIRGAGGTTNEVIFASSGAIFVSYSIGNSTTTEVIPGEFWKRGKRETWKIEYDLVMQTWRVFRGLALIYTVEIDMGFLSWIGLDLIDLGNVSSAVVIDNVMIFGDSGFTPGANDLNEDGIVDGRDMAYGLQQEILDVDSAGELLEELGFDVDDYKTLKKWKKPINKFYSKEVVPRFAGQRPNGLKKDDKELLWQVWIDDQPSIDDIIDTGLPDANDDGETDEEDIALVLEKGNLGNTARMLAILDAIGFNPGDFGSEKKWRKRMNKLYGKKIQKHFFVKRSKAEKNLDKAYLAALH
jgi:hypothetical protein